MRVLFALPGLHKIDRGAEVAFISVANELAKAGCQVTLVGSVRTASTDEQEHMSEALRGTTSARSLLCQR